MTYSSSCLGAYYPELMSPPSVAMSHRKSIVATPTWFNLPLKFPPYREASLRILRRFLS